MTLLRWRRRSKVAPPPAQSATAAGDTLWPRSIPVWVPADRAPGIAGAPNRWSARFDSEHDRRLGSPEAGLGVASPTSWDGVPRWRTRPRHVSYSR